MYSSIEELPDKLREVLPRQAQELYRAAYNRVVEKATAGHDAEADGPTVDRQAHEAAMLSIRAEFRCDSDGRWHRDPIGDDMEDPGPTRGR